MSTAERVFVVDGVGPWTLIEEYGHSFIEWTGPDGATWGVEEGDEVSVDASAYGCGRDWYTVTDIAPGSASVYPVKFELSHGGTGQCKPTEIEAVRTPRALVDVYRELQRNGLLGDRRAAMLGRRAERTCPAAHDSEEEHDG